MAGQRLGGARGEAQVVPVLLVGAPVHAGRQGLPGGWGGGSGGAEQGDVEAWGGAACREGEGQVQPPYGLVHLLSVPGWSLGGSRRSMLYMLA